MEMFFNERMTIIEDIGEKRIGLAEEADLEVDPLFRVGVFDNGSTGG